MQTDTTLETIEHLDFEFEQPCEHSQHATRHVVNQPGTLFVRHLIHPCPRGCTVPAKFVCVSGWQIAGRTGFTHCARCHGEFPRTYARDECWKIVSVI